MITGFLNHANGLRGNLIHGIYIGSNSSDHNVLTIDNSPILRSQSKLFAASEYQDILTTEQKNISNWTKNMTSFPQFENTYSNGVNHLVYTGGGGFERIWTQVEVADVGCMFRLYAKTESGYNCLYGSDTEYAFVAKAPPTSTTTRILEDPVVVATSALPKNASSNYSTITIAANTPGTYYIGIDFGYVEDNVQTIFDFSNISFSKIHYA